MPLGVALPGSGHSSAYSLMVNGSPPAQARTTARVATVSTPNIFCQGCLLPPVIPPTVRGRTRSTAAGWTASSRPPCRPRRLRRNPRLRAARFREIQRGPPALTRWLRLERTRSRQLPRASTSGARRRHSRGSRSAKSSYAANQRAIATAQILELQNEQDAARLRGKPHGAIEHVMLAAGALLAARPADGQLYPARQLPSVACADGPVGGAVRGDGQHDGHTGV